MISSLYVDLIASWQCGRCLFNHLWTDQEKNNYITGEPCQKKYRLEIFKEIHWQFLFESHHSSLYWVGPWLSLKKRLPIYRSLNTHLRTPDIVKTISLIIDLNNSIYTMNDTLKENMFILYTFHSLMPSLMDVKSCSDHAMIKILQNK